MKTPHDDENDRKGLKTPHDDEEKVRRRRKAPHAPHDDEEKERKRRKAPYADAKTMEQMSCPRCLRALRQGCVRLMVQSQSLPWRQKGFLPRSVFRSTNSHKISYGFTYEK